MRTNRWFSFALCLVMLASLAATPLPAAGDTLITHRDIIRLPTHPYTPTLPLFPPGTAPWPQPPPATEPEPPPEVKPVPLSALKLEVHADKSQARTRDTIVFSASLAGSKGTPKYALWVFRDGEQVEYFTTSQKNTWQYVAEYPGIYYGQVVGKDSEGRQIFGNSQEIVVTLNDAEEEARRTAPPGKGGDEEDEMVHVDPNAVEPFLEIDPIPDVAILETENIEIDIPIRGDAVFQAKALAHSPSFRLDDNTPSIFTEVHRVRGTRASFQVRYDAPVYQAEHYSGADHPFDESASWLEMRQWLEDLDNASPPDPGLWVGNELERTYPLRVWATCVHGAQVHDAYGDFNITILRDRNRNGVADIHELDLHPASPLVFHDVPDVMLVDTPPVSPLVNSRFPNIRIEAYHLEGDAYPIQYTAEGMPEGITFDQVQGGDYPVYRFWGSPSRIHWLYEEVRRDYKLRVHAVDEAGNKAEMVLVLSVLRCSSVDDEPDINRLMIEEVPNFVFMEGQKNGVKDHPFSVVAPSKDPVDMRLSVAFSVACFDKTEKLVDMSAANSYEEKVNALILHTRTETINFEDEAWPVGAYRKTNWTLSYNRNHRYVWWKKGERARRWTMVLEARQGERTAKRYFTVTILSSRFDDSVATPEHDFVFKHIPSQEVMDGGKIQPVAIETIGPGRVVDLHVIHKHTLDGLVYRTDVATPFHGVIHGEEVRVKDWRDGETSRINPITVSARGEPRRDKSVPKDYPSSYGDLTLYPEITFNIRVIRDPQEMDRDFLPIADQYVQEGDPIQPFKFQAEPGPVPMSKLDMTGIPKGIVRGPTGYYAGTPVIEDWGNDETEREFLIRAEGFITHNNQDRLGIETPKKTVSFTITVKRAEMKYFEEGGQDAPETAQTGAEDPEEEPADLQPAQDLGVEQPASAPEEQQPGERPDEQQPADKPDEQQPGEKPDEQQPGEKPEEQQPGEKPDEQQPGERPDEQQPAEKPDEQQPGEMPDEQQSGVKPEEQQPGVKPEEQQPGEKPDAEPQVEKLEDEQPVQPPVPFMDPAMFQPLSPEDFSQESARYTDAQKALPRVAISLFDNKQDTLTTYQGILSGLLKAGYLPDSNLFLIIVQANGSARKALELAQKLVEVECSLVIAVGEAAGAAMRKVERSMPLIVVGVDNPLKANLVGRKGNPIGPVTGVIDPPIVENLLALVKRMQPEASSAGYLYIKRDDREAARKQAVKDAGFSLQTAPMYKENPLEEVVQKMSRRTDFIVLDPSLSPYIGTQTMAAAGAVSLEPGGKPIYGTVKYLLDGCVAVCVPDFLALGEHGGQLAAAVLSGQDIMTLPFTQATATFTHINHAMAEAHGLQAPYPPEAK